MSRFLSLSLSLALSLALSLSLSRSISRSISHYLSRSLFLSLPFSLSPSLSLARSIFRALSLACAPLWTFSHVPAAPYEGGNDIVVQTTSIHLPLIHGVKDEKFVDTGQNSSFKKNQSKSAIRNYIGFPKGPPPRRRVHAKAVPRRRVVGISGPSPLKSLSLRTRGKTI